MSLFSLFEDKKYCNQVNYSLQFNVYGKAVIFSTLFLVLNVNLNSENSISSCNDL